MLPDRLPLARNTACDKARDAYVEGCACILTAYPGGAAALDRALAEDPGFIGARVARARAAQLAGDMPSARALVAGLEGQTACERSHIAVFGQLFAGQAAAAEAQARAHLVDWPRDALVLSTVANQIGLIGLSGRPGREQDLADFLGSMAGQWEDEPWFDAHYAMALSEIGAQSLAVPRVERSLALLPRNAFGAHAMGHICYETGDNAGSVAFMRGFLATYPRDGSLTGHLSWHLALDELH